MSRFSTEPSSPTSTTSARVGSMPDELDMLEADVGLAGEHDAGAARQAGQRLARLGEHGLDACGPARRPCTSRLDLPALLGREVADLQQRVDEEAQAELGRQPAGRGVRRVDQAELLEVGHDVADRGRRQRHRQDAADVARADRLAGVEIGLDDPAEDLARAPVERLQRRAGDSRRARA